MHAAPARIIVTRRLPAQIEAELSSRLQATLNPDDRQMTGDELAAALHDFDVVLCTLTDRLTRSVFAASSPIRARLLANFGVGHNHIDLAAARDQDVAVTNTPGVLTEDAADHTMLLILMVARRASEGERELRDDRWTGWRPTHLLGTRVSGKTLGIIGLGRIGLAVAERAHHGFGMRILYHSRHRGAATLEARCAATWCDTVEDVLARADFVSLHCPATPETHHLMDASRLARMSPHAFLIDTSRGDMMDEDALVASARWEACWRAPLWMCTKASPPSIPVSSLATTWSCCRISAARRWKAGSRWDDAPWRTSTHSWKVGNSLTGLAEDSARVPHSSATSDL
ncbi:MAG TPA: D-glycerate dehydrogenase [Gemmatimonadaceae bacterium]